MFEQTFVNTPAGTGKPWTVVGSLGLQAGAVLALLVAPLFHLEKLVAPVVAGPVYVSLGHARVQQARPEPALRLRHALVSPVWNSLNVPRGLSEVRLAPEAPEGGDFALSGGVGAAVVNLAPVTIMPLAIPPVPAPAKSAAVAPLVPVRISMGAQAAKLIFGPPPVYPRLAVTARMEGVVRLRALISSTGLITNLQAVSGPPLLVQSALAAVQQWRYRPTLLGTEPVEVATEIEVRFTLSR